MRFSVALPANSPLPLASPEEFPGEVDDMLCLYARPQGGRVPRGGVRVRVFVFQSRGVCVCVCLRVRLCVRVCACV